MIFKSHFIDLILAGEKTQTRRPNRGSYKEGKTYAIQPCRTCKGIPNYRIMIDRIWEEKAGDGVLFPDRIEISWRDANAEGDYGYTEYEVEFRKIYPKWNGKRRWAYKFHVVEVKK